MEALRAKGKVGVLNENDFFYERDQWELAVREYSELTDSPFYLRKDGVRARAKCPRNVCSFLCYARYGDWGIKEGTEGKIATG